jgi:hypothetical protein
MSRVVLAPVVGVAALLMFGCATDAPREPMARRVVSAQTKIVTVKQRCTTTIKTEDICAKPQPCYLIETCAEAYYRYTVCKDLSLDGGSGYPRNGIPCQKLCSEKAQALEMANKIIERPFSPQARSEIACSPG